VADYVGIKKHEEDFGQTLGFYGVGSGPYLVLPILGPSSLRDGVGTAVDAVAFYALKDELIDELDMDDSDEDLLKWGLFALDAIDQRHKHDFRYYETGSPFEYELIRMLYLQKRVLEIND
jgi:phospholipid-binding lipoprotein MlaA